MSAQVAAKQKKNVTVLAVLQALLMTNNSTAIALNGLAGYALASNKALATVPVTGWVVGAALTTFFASLLMKRIGRKGGFTFGTLVGIVGASVCCVALYIGSFWLFVAGTTVFGVYNAFGQYYRFAAADAASHEFKARAISLVLAGGLVGGIVGPTVSKWTKDLLPTTFLGAYVVLIAFLFVVLAVVRLLDIPAPTGAEAKESGRPLAEIAAQPAFVVAALAAAFGYGVMNLLMTATPLAMGVCGHPYSAAATVISWHVIGMFAPSFFTGNLIKRFGVLNVMLAGVVLNFACIGIALAGVDVPNFWVALFLLGVGWNFLYIGGTALLTETYRPAEKAKAQGANDLVIFVVMATSSFASGLLLETNGWQLLNYLAIPFVAAVGIAVLWLMTRRRVPAVA
ncbi:MAG TPA: MFS transporter [Burkholderiales bacterium]|nr:MFS transporter [Burkholderiales bacterium]